MPIASAVNLPVVIHRAGRLTTAWACCAGLAHGCGTRGDLSLGQLGSRERSAPSDGGVGETRDAADLTSAAPLESSSLELPTVTTTQGNGDAEVTAPCSTELPLPSERFDFSGAGTEVVDVMGGPSGALLGGAALNGAGAVSLDGDDDYVDLPNALLSSKTSATILLWTTLQDGPAYWRVLDFGNSSAGEDPTDSAVGTTYVALTTETGLDPSGLALFIGHGGASAEDRALTALNLDDTAVALGVVLDGEAQRADLYVDGTVVATTPMSNALSELDDVNNWLGRSQYSADPHYPGTYTELRIYDRALSACDLAALSTLGPDLTR